MALRVTLLTASSKGHMEPVPNAALLVASRTFMMLHVLAQAPKRVAKLLRGTLLVMGPPPSIVTSLPFATDAIGYRRHPLAVSPSKRQSTALSAAVTSTAAFKSEESVNVAEWCQCILSPRLHLLPFCWKKLLLIAVQCCCCGGEGGPLVRPSALTAAKKCWRKLNVGTARNSELRSSRSRRAGPGGLRHPSSVSHRAGIHTSGLLLLHAHGPGHPRSEHHGADRVFSPISLPPRPKI